MRSRDRWIFEKNFEISFEFRVERCVWLVTLMLVTDVGDQMTWSQVLDVGDKSRHQHQQLGTNIKNRSQTS